MNINDYVRKPQNSHKQTLKKYNITEAHYNNLLREQNYGCAICRGNNGGRRLCIDHDHEENIVRGLLCGRCNIGIGYLLDNTDIIKSAVDYLHKAMDKKIERQIRRKYKEAKDKYDV